MFNLTVSGDVMPNNQLGNALMIVSVVSAAVISAAVARRAFSSGTPQRQEYVGTEVQKWREYASSGHADGSPEAPVTVVVFEDFECPACRKFNLVLDSVLARYPSDVRIVHRHLPLESIHAYAKSAAVAAECARGSGKFREYTRALYREQQSFGEKTWAAFAVQVGITDTVEFNRCLLGEAATRVVQADTLVTKALALKSTPSYLLNNTLYRGGAPLMVMSGLIDAELAKAR